MRARLAILVASAILAVTGAGCGDDGEPESGSAPDTTPSKQGPSGDGSQQLPPEEPHNGAGGNLDSGG